MLVTPSRSPSIAIRPRGTNGSRQKQKKQISRSTLTITYKSDANPSGAAGVGRTYFITVTAIKPGSAKLALEYLRDWEEQEPAQTFNLQLKVIESTEE